MTRLIIFRYEYLYHIKNFIYKENNNPICIKGT